MHAQNMSMGMEKQLARTVQCSLVQWRLAADVAQI
jgi:hypothetical protein